MVVVPSGKFQMGSTDEEIQRSLATVPAGNGPLGMLWLFGQGDRQSAARFMAYSKPKHEVVLARAFAMGRFPVTRSEFAMFVKETGYKTGPCWSYNTSRPRPISNR